MVGSAERASILAVRYFGAFSTRSLLFRLRFEEAARRRGAAVMPALDSARQSRDFTRMADIVVLDQPINAEPSQPPRKPGTFTAETARKPAHG
jgi:hypothetical protein